MFEIAKFEFVSRARLWSTWIYFLVFALLAGLWMAAAGGEFATTRVVFGSGKVAINSPFAISAMVSLTGVFGMIIIAAVMGRSIQQDFEYRTHPFFFSAPLSRLDYLVGRFLGACGVCLVVFAGTALGAYLATHLPGIDPDKLQPNRLSSYLAPYALLLLPNLFFSGAVFFALVCLTRRMLPAYVASIVFVVGWLVSVSLTRDLDNKLVAALVDPFGLSALSIVTKYWTIAERSTRDIPLSGYLLYNRALWVGVGALIAAFGVWRFAFNETVAVARQRGAAAGATDVAAAARPRPSVRVTLRPERRAAAFVGLVRLYFVEVVRSVYFGVLVLAGVGLMIVASSSNNERYGTQSWPVTFTMLSTISDSFALFMLIIISFYAGELAWRERDYRVDQIIDATPVATALPFLAKLGALMLVPFVLQAFLILCAVVIQVTHGYYRIEPWLYIHDFFGIRLIDYWFLCVLTLFVHSVVNQKYMAHAIVVLYYVCASFSHSLNLDDNLFKPGSVPSLPYSDLNGYGQFLWRTRVFQFYWSALAVLLAVLAYLFWQRGTASSLAERLAVARSRVTRLPVVWAVAGTTAFVCCGAYIYYNTHVLNTYMTQHDKDALVAEREKRYKRYADLPQPRVTQLDVDVDLYPRTQGARVRGSAELENRSSGPIDMLYVEVPPWATGKARIHRLDLDVANQLVEDDSRIGVRRYQLAEPLAPGQKAHLSFDIEQVTPGFENADATTTIVANGTFLPGEDILPRLGYDAHEELSNDDDRKRFGLLPKARLRDRDDPAAQAVNGITPGLDWLHFNATVTTDADQIGIAPGTLVETSLAGDRRRFVYRMDTPALGVVGFQSARYAVKRGSWHDPVQQRDVPIEIYYQPGHEFNLERMLASAQASLTYCTTQFGPYQHQLLRIVEFPRYQTFAESLPNTIPYSESIGFIARVRPDDPNDVDYPYYVTAHEVAHQWWAHQVAGADAQGSAMLSETLAQYTALMIMKRAVGEHSMHKFLAYELDAYLMGRAGEDKVEMPLSRVEQQAYIYYRKGSVVMYALQDYLGEDRVNAVLREFRDAHAFKGPPYPTSEELVERFRRAADPEFRPVIDDLFERIVLFDNRALSARAHQRSDGRFETVIDVRAKKLEADATGHEHDLPVADWIDVGVVDEHGDALAVSRERIDSESAQFTIVSDARPVRAGIDPQHKLIDRRPDDNTVAVEWSGATP